jgi:hypothetical protein
MKLRESPNCHPERPVRAKGLCNSCYRKQHYQANLAREREARRISGKAYYQTPRGRFRFSQKRAEQRRLSWNISEEFYGELLKMPCVYCRQPLNRMGCGLDRVDNARGYEEDNVRPCCGACNRIRGDNLTAEEMHIVMNALSIYRRSNREAA